jgi:hypothetical protein
MSPYTYGNLARLYAVMQSPSFSIDVRLAAGCVLVSYLEKVVESSPMGGGNRQLEEEEE